MLEVAATVIAALPACRFVNGPVKATWNRFVVPTRVIVAAFSWNVPCVSLMSASAGAAKDAADVSYSTSTLSEVVGTSRSAFSCGV